MYTQVTFFKLKKIKSHFIIHNLRLWDFFIGTEERVQNSHGKQAIRVRAIEVLL